LLSNREDEFNNLNNRIKKLEGQLKDYR
jgi:hypothetical protein